MIPRQYQVFYKILPRGKVILEERDIETSQTMRHE